MTESRLTESEPDEDAVAGERDELLASLLDDTLIEDMAAKIEGFDDDFAEPEDEQVRGVRAPPSSRVGSTKCASRQPSCAGQPLLIRQE